MNQRLEPLLKEYIRDTLEHHREYHHGRIEECGYTGCRFAVDLMNGRVKEETYLAIIKGDVEGI